MATKFERIEVDLPQDIIFAMRGLKKRELKEESLLCWHINFYQHQVQY